jgi:tetratricopeptide (TPR) repeat protein
VERERSLAPAHLLLGLCLRDQNQWKEARAALETAVQLEPGLTAPREALVSLYLDSGQTARAIEQLEALVALDLERPARLVALGRAYADAGRHDAAIMTLGRAVERFPDSSQSYGALGRVWLESAESRRDPVALGKAVEALSTAASHPDVASETLTDLGRAWMLVGNPGESERALRRAIAKLPVDADAYLHLATIVGRTRVQEARDSLLRYATLIGDRRPLATVATRIAEYSLQLGEPHVARRWVARAIEESGETPVLVALRERAGTRN